MHVSLVRCHLRHATDVPSRMCKEAAEPEMKTVPGQARDFYIYI